MVRTSLCGKRKWHLEEGNHYLCSLKRDAYSFMYKMKYLMHKCSNCSYKNTTHMGILRKELGDHLQVVLADFVAMFV